MEPIKNGMNKLLVEGQFVGTDATVSQFCANLLEIEAALWMFTKTEGVEPTNNHMERLLRLAVLWRKCCFGCHSEQGCRFVERLITAVQSLRLQKRSVLEFLRIAIQAHRVGEKTPSLLPRG